MLCIEMVLLGGRYRACSFEDRRLHEWPPAPARFYFAAVDAVYRAETASEDEIAALRWWEQLGAPEISCADVERFPDGWARQGFTIRNVVNHYVPGNYASSSTRDLNSHWERIEQALATLDTATASGSDKDIGRAERAVRQAQEKLRTDTSRLTAAASRESAETIASVLQLLPENRDRQPRWFPVVTPDDPRVYFTWPQADSAAAESSALDVILSRIGRVGHSSSVVSCRVVDAPATPPSWVPADPAVPPGEALEIRTPTSGLHDALVMEFSRHQGTSERVLPAVMTRYVQPGPQTKAATRQQGLGDWLVMALPAGQRLPMARTQDVTRAVRGALMAHASQPVSPTISGHSGEPGDTTPTEQPHMSVLALPNVSHVHSDGLIHGVALGLPAGITADDRAAIINALNQWALNSAADGHDLQLPGGRVRHLGAAVMHAASGAGSPVPGSDRHVTSRRFWARLARCWSSVTPVALDRHPKISKGADYEEFSEVIAPLVAEMCSRVGLPPPLEVTASPAAVWAAVPPVGTGGPRASRAVFPQFRVGGRADRRRFTTHLTIEFTEPVRGPIVLGAGRYFGYGLFLPTPGCSRNDRGAGHDRV